MLAGAVVGAPAASAARLLTWTTTSRHVDFAGEPHIPPPPGVGSGLHVDVLLPAGYDGRRRFPVLYLLHGHGGRFDSWIDPAGGDLRRTARGLRAIVVMPEGGNGWYADWWQGGRRRPGWERYHLDELIPVIERRLRIRRGRRWHAIAGLSMGGEGAMFYAAQRPGYFGAAASFSGPLDTQRPEWPPSFDTQGERHLDVFGDPVAQRFYWTGHNPTALAGNLTLTRLFVSVGDGTALTVADRADSFGAIAEKVLRRQSEDFVTAARRADARVTFTPHRGIHAWPYWRRDLRRAIRWGLFRPLTARPRRWRYATVARTGDMWGIRFAFPRGPTTLERFSYAGGALRARGSGAVRVRAPGNGPFTARLPFRRALRSRP